MLSTSKTIVIEYLELMVEKAELVIQRNVSILSYQKHQGCSHTEVRPREDTGRKWPSASQGE